jgi:hypothetical protein
MASLKPVVGGETDWKTRTFLRTEVKVTSTFWEKRLRFMFLKMKICNKQNVRRNIRKKEGEGADPGVSFGIVTGMSAKICVVLHLLYYYYYYFFFGSIWLRIGTGGGLL